MSHAFDGQSFAHVLDDCERLLAGAADHEHRFALLLSELEQDCEIGGSSVTGRAAGAESNPMIEPSPSGRANDLLATVRRSCIDARQQRQLIETMLSRLVGDRALGHRASEGGNRVLVVDDSADSRDMAADVLEMHGFHAVTAENGLEALIVAHYARPVVVVMDLTMPILDGIQAARLLKASSVTRHLNVIAYTAKPDAIEGPLARFFAHVLRKPTKPELIAASVRQFLVPWPSRAERTTPPRSI
jgi:CheY-like chemotaxis protein